MNGYDDLSNEDVLRAAARSMATIPAAAPPDVNAIMARGRARRRHQLAGAGMAGVTGIAGVAVTSLALTGGLGGGGTAGTGGGIGTIHTEAFTLSENANGTAELRLNRAETFNPEALQRALAQDGIPALVTSGRYCSSDPALPSPHHLGVLSVLVPDGIPLGPPGPSSEQSVPPGSVTVINPAKLPAGTKLFFDYTRTGGSESLTGGLLATHSYTCVKGGPPNGPGK
jgi:hypothetical protein